MGIDSNKESTVSNFYISKFEITQEQWRAVMGSNPSRYATCAKCPVETISCYLDAEQYINQLNKKTGKSTVCYQNWNGIIRK
ncbi:MAG: SUMF1/EgtB/PvdO family nonheme iron enzyme [Lewinellaceae bacterium]|nr:SUMF1/EgtB/PvdO family nonheme iron enzyme [Lewinellaceae bacterium]